MQRKWCNYKKTWSYHEYVQSELNFETKLDIDWWNYQMFFEEL